jgi:hypothetical protein
MWRPETLQNSTATALLLLVPDITIFLPGTTLIDLSVVSAQNRRRVVRSSCWGFATANKEAAIDALRPGESERRL